MEERLSLIESAKSKTAKLKALSGFIKEAYQRGVGKREPLKLETADASNIFIGHEVSVDISTGEEDAGVRIFGKIDGINGCDNDAGFTLLVTDPVYNSDPKHLSFVEAMRFLYAGKSVRPKGYRTWLVRCGQGTVWTESDGSYSKSLPCFNNISLDHVWESK